MLEQQTTSHVLMIRPVSFAANEQTAESNRFQQVHRNFDNAASQARTEFDDLVLALQTAGVNVHVFEGAQSPRTPDAVFPNNWVSFHADGTVVLYPMLAPNRRLERRTDILDVLSKEQHFHIRQVIDLTYRENKDQFLEGTGSLVLDRVNRIAYACLSPRTDLDSLGEFAQRLDYEIVAFEAVDQAGIPIYHTNVLLSVGTNFAAVCVEAILPSYRAGVRDALQLTHHQLVEITPSQMNNFAGNMLELSTATGGRVVALSERAAHALTARQREQLVECSGQLVSTAIPTIETLGGGSVRCMIAEIHLPIYHAA
jgi:hypothetical protein